MSLAAALGLTGASAASAQSASSAEPETSSSGAVVPLTPGCRAANEYIDLAMAGRYQDIGSLFAEKVDYVGPDAIARSNREEVTKVYAALGQAEKKAGKPHGPILKRLVPLNENECFMEFEIFDFPAGAYRLYAVDHFIVGPDGKIVWFRPYFQESSLHWHDDYVAATAK
jgi:hypothetical protein